MWDVSFLSSGRMFDHGHVTRATCCRVSDALQEYLPRGYSLRHPYIGRVTTVQTPQDIGTVAMLSVNWCEADEFIEVLDSKTGKSITTYVQRLLSRIGLHCIVACPNLYFVFCNLYLSISDH